MSGGYARRYAAAAGRARPRAPRIALAAMAACAACLSCAPVTEKSRASRYDVPRNISGPARDAEETDVQTEIQAGPQAAAQAAGHDAGQPVGYVPSAGTHPLLKCRFYDEHGFRQATARAKSYDAAAEILCGVVPHHLLAGEMIASFFRTAAESRPDVKTVVLVAPMHAPRRDKLCTTLSGWSAPTGVLPNERSFSEAFVTELGAAVDDDMLQEDHSVSALIPFVKHYFPDASAACLMISGSSDEDIPERAAGLFMELSKEKNCLFVFSVDFSHYLNPDETAARDTETREAVMDFDLERISRMGNDNMDSPKCVCTFLMLTRTLDGDVYELDHRNSLEITGLPYPHPAFAEGLTSYFILSGG